MPFPEFRPLYPFLVPNGRYTDAEVVCSRSKIKVHKVVLCGVSSTLESAFKPGVRRDQIDCHMYDWDSTARMIEWAYYGGYQTPSEKTRAASIEDDAAPETAADADHSITAALREADLKLHFGILRIAKAFSIEALCQKERGDILSIMNMTSDITTLVLCLDLLHKVVRDEHLVRYASTQVAEKLPELLQSPTFDRLWLPGSFYKTIVDRCSRSGETGMDQRDLLDSEAVARNKENVSKGALYSSLVSLK